MTYQAPIRRVLVSVVLLSVGAMTVACPDSEDADGDDDDVADASASTTGTTGGSGTTFGFECTPGEVQCGADISTIERCAPTGQAWIPEVCPSMTTCRPCEDDTCTQAQCLGECEISDDIPSSAGCSFIANRQLHLQVDFPDGLVVANPNPDVDAMLTLYLTPEGMNVEEEIATFLLAPLSSTSFSLQNNFVQTESSMFRTGGTHRIQSDVPVVAYHHAPEAYARGNDSSMLLPESALRNDYVVTSYKPNFNPTGTDGQPTYFEIVAIQNFTTVEWFPPVATAGNGLPVPAVPAGGRGELKMNRFDTARIAASVSASDVPQDRDVSGTVITADKPIWVTAGSRCSRVPHRNPDDYPTGYCDPLQELMIPLAYWGSTYVAAHSPDRDSEDHHWRIYAGTDGVTVTPDRDDIDGLPVTFEERGDFVDVKVANGVSFVLHSDDGVFMPVQYLQSARYPDAPNPEPEMFFTPKGDPSMYQMIPVEQFLDRYVFATALNFPLNYVQVIRAAGGPPVTIEGDALSATEIPEDLYELVGEYEVADYQLEAEGAYVIYSGEPFGIIQIGYSSGELDMKCALEEEYIDPVTGNHLRTCRSSYAYPGGMKSEPIYIP
jgi:hypothetical protein